ncbi:MAG: fatty acid desaturase, partial [Nocardioidaceae bacterium]|nr:fatty acid desaturase [Nocardioidaceae bacterium]
MTTTDASSTVPENAPVRPTATARPDAERAHGNRPVQGLPDPGERVPPLAWPPVALYVATLGVLAAEILLYVAGVSAWVTVPLGAAATFMAFSVVHEATHHAVSTNTGLNNTFGRLGMPVFVPYAPFSLLKFVHIEHHRNTNEAKDVDPDAWTSEGAWWQLPFRWATIDFWYVVFYCRRISRRPRGEQLAVVLNAVAFAALVALVVATGHLMTLVVLVLVPQRIGLVVLAWWFDYLPHNGLTATQRENKYRATRVRVGGEKVLTPLFVYQNYHLVHHLHPSIPFYRYVRAWRRNESAYLDRDAAISTWFGRSLTAEEYRTWRRITDPLEPATGGRPVFHPLRVAEIETVTEDSVRVTFEVPEDLRDAYRFTAGQHVTLRAVIDGSDVRRTYSICSSEQSGLLQVGVRRHQGGVFSTYATTELAVGDILDVLAPNGSFGELPEVASGAQTHLAAVAAGSGITPVLSVIATALDRDPTTRATLVYANRLPGTEMFAKDLDALVERHGDRFTLVRHYSDADPSIGQLDPSTIASLVDGPQEVSCWYLCGPTDLVTSIRTGLSENGVPEDKMRSEKFTGATTGQESPRATVADIEADVVVTLDGRDTTLRFNSGGPTLLEAA